MRLCYVIVSTSWLPTITQTFPRNSNAAALTAQKETLPISRHFRVDMYFKAEFLILTLTLLDHRLFALGGDNSD